MPICTVASVVEASAVATSKELICTSFVVQCLQNLNITKCQTQDEAAARGRETRERLVSIKCRQIRHHMTRRTSRPRTELPKPTSFEVYGMMITLSGSFLVSGWHSTKTCPRPQSRSSTQSSLSLLLLAKDKSWQMIKASTTKTEVEDVFGLIKFFVVKDFVKGLNFAKKCQSGPIISFS